MNEIIIIFLCLFFFNHYKKNIVHEEKYKNEYVLSFDSISLCAFWSNFQYNISNGRKKEVIDALEFPIHAIFPVIFRYAHDCDTITYIKNMKKYYDFDITMSNIDEYYDFIFTNTLKKIIKQTTIQNLLDSKDVSSGGFILMFFPKDYDIKVNCSNDHLMKFYIGYDNKQWKIGIGGL